MNKFGYWGSVVYAQFSDWLALRAFNPNLLSEVEIDAKCKEVFEDSGRSAIVLPTEWVVLNQQGLFVDGTSGEEFFNDLCNVVLYHFFDVTHKAGSLKSRSCRRLIDGNYTGDTRTIDPERVYGVYEEAVISYGRHVLGPKWIREHDHWGAVCLHEGPRGQDERKDHMLVGDACGRIAFFTCMQALREHMYAKKEQLASA